MNETILWKSNREEDRRNLQYPLAVLGAYPRVHQPQHEFVPVRTLSFLFFQKEAFVDDFERVRSRRSMKNNGRGEVLASGGGRLPRIPSFYCVSLMLLHTVSS
jgi:hypothetical protein